MKLPRLGAPPDSIEVLVGTREIVKVLVKGFRDAELKLHSAAASDNAARIPPPSPLIFYGMRDGFLEDGNLGECWGAALIVGAVAHSSKFLDLHIRSRLREEVARTPRATAELETFLGD